MQNINLITICLFSILTFSCNSSKKENKNNANLASQSIRPELQTILDSVNLDGVILIYDKKANIYYSNDFSKSREGYLPASTFKIPNSIIGLELKILENDQTVFKWDGTDRFLPVWEQDLTLKEAFQTSCVPCYQELAREIGIKRMKEYIEKLKFGEMYMTEKSIDNFWLIGSSKINTFQQIDFLKRLNEEQLPISKSTCKTVKSIMEIESKEDYSLSGKTGLSVVSGKKDIGWFVGYVKKKGNVYYFATKISPKTDDMLRSDFTPLRQKVSIMALRKMKMIE